MYDRILVAVDHSELSDKAVLAARDLATLSHGEVWVLHLSLSFNLISIHIGPYAEYSLICPGDV